MQEIANGQTTTFLMDYNTGLTQVLNDGTNNYIYGNGRIAQANGTGTEYFLGDALGSVRQLTNTSGAITYASAYNPYGVTTRSYGASQTAYGYTGEYTDSYIKLIYLRSRWYDPASGRFTTRDSWQGDYNRPLSLNRWMYTEGNPVNYTDPSGFFITPANIAAGSAVYSCNCGWIDFTHANPTIPNQIHNAVKTAQRLTPPKSTPYINFIQDQVVIQVNITVGKDIGIGAIEYTQRYRERVDLGLAPKEQWEVTLAIWMDASNRQEHLYGGSSFSEEDLTSDMIAFYLAYNKYGDPRPGQSGNAWRELARLCGFNEDRQEAKKQSLAVYERYGKGKRVKDWNSPRLFVNADVEKYLCDEGMCPNQRAWPSEFLMVQPDTDHWSPYVPANSILAHSGYENIYYEGEVPLWRPY